MRRGMRALTCGTAAALALAVPVALSGAVGQARAASTRALQVPSAIRTFQVPSANSGLHEITAGPDGNVYFTEDQDVTDAGGNPVFHVGELTTGGQVSEIPVPFGESDSTGFHMGPTAIASSGGRLWFLSDVGDSLYTLAPGASSVSGPVGFPLGDNGEELAPAPNGGVWMSTEPGTDMALVDANGTPSYFTVNEQGSPWTVAANAAGGVDFANGSTTLGSIDAGGATASHPLPTDGQGGEVYSMALDRGGNMWYASYHTSFDTGCFDAAIGVLPRGATSGRTVATLDPANGRGPCATDLALGPDGAIWFTWTSTPDGVTNKVPSGVGRVDTASGRIQLLDTVHSNSVVPSGLAFAGDGNLYFIDRIDNLVGRLSGPTRLFAGAGGGATTKQKLPAAPKVAVTVPRTRLRTLARHPAITLRCTLGGAGRCAAAAQVPATVGRSLHVKVARKAKTATLARASHRYRRKGTATVTLRFSRALARRMSHRRTLKVTFVATSSASRHRNRTAHRTVTLKR